MVISICTARNFLFQDVHSGTVPPPGRVPCAARKCIKNFSMKLGVWVHRFRTHKHIATYKLDNHTLKICSVSPLVCVEHSKIFSWSTRPVGGWRFSRHQDELFDTFKVKFLRSERRSMHKIHSSHSKCILHCCRQPKSNSLWALVASFLVKVLPFWISLIF